VTRAASKIFKMLPSQDALQGRKASGHIWIQC